MCYMLAAGTKSLGSCISTLQHVLCATLSHVCTLLSPYGSAVAYVSVARFRPRLAACSSVGSSIVVVLVDGSACSLVAENLSTLIESPTSISPCSRAFQLVLALARKFSVTPTDCG